METFRYADFSLGVHRRLAGKRIPLSGAVEVTRRCPLRCLHCYNNLPMSDSISERDELTYREHCRILDEITDAGCLWLLFTGGEILARDDFLDIYTYAKKKGLLITLFTNGTLISPKIADYLAEWRPFSIEITLYGRTKETFERITRVPGSFERCMGGIRVLMERGLPLKLKTMAITLNKHELWDMKRFAEEELGVAFKFDAMINPRIDCSQSPLSFRLKPEEVVELDLQDPKRMAEWRSVAEKFNGPVPVPALRDQLYICGGGMYSFAIDPSGRLEICAFSCREAYPLRNGNFREGWENFLLRVRKKKITRETKCFPCEIKALCGMCPAIGELEGRDGEEPVDFLCRVAHLRAKAFGIGLQPHGECEYCKD